MDGEKFGLDDVTVTDEKVIKRAVQAAALGNVTEWYDFGVYSYLTAIIAKVFFSGLPNGLALVATLGTFAVSFLIRPFGGLFFGPLGDRVGRTKVLSITVIMMAIGTFILGVIPSYAAIGIAAPLLVLFGRLVQGFSTGGEYGGAMTFIAEYAPDKRRGFLGSWLEFGTLTGYVMGATLVTVLTTVLSDSQMLSWGWRIPFLLALPLGIVGLYLRGRIYGYILLGELIGSGLGLVVPGSVAGAISWRASFIVLSVPGLALAWGVHRLLPEPVRGGHSLAVEGDGDADPAPDDEVGLVEKAQRAQGTTPHKSLVLTMDPATMSMHDAVRYVLSIRTNVVLIVASSLAYFFFTGLQTFAVEFLRGRFGLGQSVASAVTWPPPSPRRSAPRRRIDAPLRSAARRSSAYGDFDSTFRCACATIAL